MQVWILNIALVRNAQRALRMYSTSRCAIQAPSRRGGLLLLHPLTPSYCLRPFGALRMLVLEHEARRGNRRDLARGKAMARARLPRELRLLALAFAIQTRCELFLAHSASYSELHLFTCFCTRVAFL